MSLHPIREIVIKSGIYSAIAILGIEIMCMLLQRFG